MTTRALEDKEIQAIFENIDGCNAVRNRAMMIAGIGMALRANEIVGLNVGDVFDGEKTILLTIHHLLHVKRQRILSLT